VTLIWGASWSAVKTALGYAPPFSFSAQQFLISTIVLLLPLIAARNEFPKNRTTLSRILIFSLINAINIAFTNFGLQYESSGTGAMLTFTQPLIVFVLSVLLLNEKIQVLKILGVIVGFLGVTILSLKGSGTVMSFSVTSLFLIFGAFFWALSTIFYKKYLNNVNLTVITTLQFAVGFVLLFILGKFFEGFPLPTNSTYIAILVYMSIGPTVFGTTIWLYLLSREDPTNLSTYGFITPIIAMVFGWWLLGEEINERSFLGVGLIIVGVYLVQKQWYKNKETSRTN